MNCVEQFLPKLVCRHLSPTTQALANGHFDCSCDSNLSQYLQASVRHGRLERASALPCLEPDLCCIIKNHTAAGAVSILQPALQDDRSVAATAALHDRTEFEFPSIEVCMEVLN